MRWGDWIKVFDVKEAIGAHGAYAVGRFPTAVTGGEDRLLGLVVCTEHANPFHPLGDLIARGGKRKSRYADMLDQVVPLLPLWDARASDDQWNVGAFVVKELLAPGVADPVVGEEYDQGIFKDTFLFEPLHDLSDVPVGNFYGVEVSGPVLQNDRVLRIIGGQADFFMRGGLHPELVFHSFLQSPIAGLRCPPQLASMELDLHEKRLTALAVGPIMAVIHVDRPIEVVVGLAPFVSGGGHAAKIESFESASDAGKVSRF